MLEALVVREKAKRCAMEEEPYAQEVQDCSVTGKGVLAGPIECTIGLTCHIGEVVVPYGK